MIVDLKENSLEDLSDGGLRNTPNMKLQFDVSENQSEGSQSEKREQLNEGRWSEQDNLRFVVFIHKHQEIFNSKHYRKSCKIFKLFSQYLINRTPEQCRSHFQKFMIKYKTIAKLKRFYRKKFGEQIYNSEMGRLGQCTTSSSNKSMDSFEVEKERKEFGVQTEEKADGEGLSNLTTPYQALNYLSFFDYQEYYKLLALNLEQSSEGFYWACICQNNPQFA